MPTTYNVKDGDTFERIARQQYGTELEAGRIAGANPGVIEPLIAGTVLTVPPDPNAIEAAAPIPFNDASEVSVSINGERFRFWDRLRIVRAIDSMDIVELGAPMESTLPGFRESFRPFSFAPMEVSVGGALLFKGTAVGVMPSVSNDVKVVSISGYSLPGVLNDCTPPASSFPLEFNEQGLKEIAEALLEPFGIGVVFDGDPGAAFDREAIEPGTRIQSFLATLAKQKALIMSNTAEGELLFLQPTEDGDPVARLAQGEPPVLSINPFFSPQQYYSSITGIDPVIVGFEGGQFTVSNPRLEGVLRPITFEPADALEGDLKTAVEAKAGRMFADMASYSVRVATWRDSSGALWEPNTLVTLTAPDAMVYNEFTFLIRTVDFDKNSVSETATLRLVIPGSFSGKMPEVLPWD